MGILFIEPYTTIYMMMNNKIFLAFVQKRELMDTRRLLKIPNPESASPYYYPHVDCRFLISSDKIGDYSHIKKKLLKSLALKGDTGGRYHVTISRGRAGFDCVWKGEVSDKEITAMKKRLLRLN